MSRTIGKEISPSRSVSCGQGPTLIIWCTAGVSGMLIPAMSPSLGLHTPAAMTTVLASMSPPVVRTRVIRRVPWGPSSVSRPVTSTVGTTVSSPVARARSRMMVPARRESTTPTPGVQKAPMNWSSSMKGTFSLTKAGGTSSASMPQARALDIRRRSSSIRSSVRAISKPPDSVKTPISLYWRTESSVRSVISREWSTGKMKFDACPVDPPGFGSGPLSSCTMSRQPSRARWWTRLLPTMPAPMTTTRAVAGTSAMSLSGDAGVDGGVIGPTVASCATQCTMRDNPRMSRARPGCQWPGRARVGPASVRWSRGHAGPLEPGVDLVRVGVDPLLRRLLRVHLVLGDVLRHEVLVVVVPVEVLHQRVRRAAGVGEVLRDDLVQRVRRVVAGDLGRVGVAPGGVLRQVDLDQRHLGEEPLRLVEVADHRGLVLLRLAEGLDEGGLAAGEDHLVVEVEVLHQRLVVGDEAGVT